MRQVGFLLEEWLRNEIDRVRKPMGLTITGYIKRALVLVLIRDLGSKEPEQPAAGSLEKEMPA